MIVRRSSSHLSIEEERDEEEANGAISLECGKGGSKAFANGAYSAWVNEDAVNVYLNNAGKFTLVKTYKNRG